MNLEKSCLWTDFKSCKEIPPSQDKLRDMANFYMIVGYGILGCRWFCSWSITLKAALQSNKWLVITHKRTYVYFLMIIWSLINIKIVCALWKMRPYLFFHYYVCSAGSNYQSSFSVTKEFPYFPLFLSKHIWIEGKCWMNICHFFG